MAVPAGADGAALIAAAVRAADLAKASRRTVAAVAGAVASAMAPAQHRRPREPAEAVVQTSEIGSSPEELLASLRAARAAQRRKNKLRRREAKACRSAIPIPADAAAELEEVPVVEMGASAGAEQETSPPPVEASPRLRHTSGSSGPLLVTAP